MVCLNLRRNKKGKPNRVKQIYGDRFPRAGSGAGSISKWYGSTTLSKIIVFVKVNIIFYVQSDHPRMLLVLVHSFFDTYSFLLQHKRWSKIIVIVKVNIIFCGALCIWRICILVFKTVLLNCMYLFTHFLTPNHFCYAYFWDSRKSCSKL